MWFHSQVFRTRRASDGVVFIAERPNISFVTWNEESFAKLSEIVFRCVGSKESDWWSEIRCCDNFKTYHVNSVAVTKFTIFCINVKLVFESQTLGYRPNPVSRKKISQTLREILKKSLALKVKKYGNYGATLLWKNREIEESESLYLKKRFPISFVQSSNVKTSWKINWSWKRLIGEI